jgi:hypothetical protein
MEKQKMTTHAKIFSTLALLILTAAAVSAQRNQGPAAVNLNVVIDDSVSNSHAGFGSDGAGAYAHGSQGVIAQFLSTGVLEFKTGNRTAAMHYGAPLEPVGNVLAGPTIGPSRFITIVRSGLYLQTMDIGSTRCERLVGSQPISSDRDRYVGYRAGHGTLTDLAHVLVTRVDANTWTMDSNTGGQCNSAENDNVARINDSKTKGKADTIFHGRYIMPLRLVLTRQ